MDFLSVRNSVEDGCLEFLSDRKSAYVIKPKRLIMQYFPRTPGESFFLLDLDTLEPTDVYEDVNDRGSEELFEGEPGDYQERYIADQGFLRLDENEREVPFPRGWRITQRYFRGKILFVAKGSLWNGDPGTYDARHNRMTSTQIRALISRSLAR